MNREELVVFKVILRSDSLEKALKMCGAVSQMFSWMERERSNLWLYCATTQGVMWENMCVNKEGEKRKCLTSDSLFRQPAKIERKCTSRVTRTSPVYSDLDPGSAGEMFEGFIFCFV